MLQIWGWTGFWLHIPWAAAVLLRHNKDMIAGRKSHQHALGQCPSCCEILAPLLVPGGARSRGPGLLAPAPAAAHLACASASTSKHGPLLQASPCIKLIASKLGLLFVALLAEGLAMCSAGGLTLGQGASAMPLPRLLGGGAGGGATRCAHRGSHRTHPGELTSSLALRAASIT